LLRFELAGRIEASGEAVNRPSMKRIPSGSIIPIPCIADAMFQNVVVGRERAGEEFGCSCARPHPV
jgi:hypothetical protein